ncbi:hypothetical protein, partial [Vibrio parahaemolyticus]|uniref:hypothetical protein n=1 Tax=Vibrio parahaemolyticus TaxID=670 RepID=UPI001BAF23DB
SPFYLYCFSEKSGISMEFTDSYKLACATYCAKNQRLTDVILCIEAVLAGFTVKEIIEHRLARNLSIRSIQHYHSKY